MIDPGYIYTAIASALCVWMLTKFLNKTVGTEYVKRVDFKKFIEEHNRHCQGCQSKAAVVQIKALLVELAIKAGVPAHEVAKIANIGNDQGGQHG